MNAEQYLRNQGWVKGEALQKGGIKHPLLVKHRKDTKGLGYNPLANEGWWEQVFNGHLQSLNVTNGDSIAFSQDEEKLRKSTSILYTRFRPGGVLAGTLETDVVYSDAQDKIKVKTKKDKKDKNSKKKRKSKDKSSNSDSGELSNKSKDKKRKASDNNESKERSKKKKREIKI